MDIKPLEIPEVLLITPRIFKDDRGYFLETYSTRTFPEQDPPIAFVQDNLSFSSKGTVRGLHLQEPNAQGKLVSAMSGTIWDVAVDVRVGSPTYGKWVAAELSAESRQQLYVPPGFAHGFCVLSETAHMHYKCTDLYNPKTELSLRYDDPDLAIDWPLKDALLSPKDAAAPLLKDVPPDRLPQFNKK